MRDETDQVSSVFNSQVAHGMWMWAVQAEARKAQWQTPRYFLLAKTVVYLGLVELCEVTFEKVYSLKMIGDLKLIGHNTKRPMITSQIQLPFDKKSQLYSGSFMW